MSNGIKYAIHAYAWTGEWTPQSIELIDRAKRLGFDCIEIPLMDLGGVQPDAIAKRLKSVGIDVCTSTACSEVTDPTSDDPKIRKQALEYLKKCVDATAAMGAKVFTGVIYSAIGHRLPQPPTAEHWQRARDVLKQVAQYAQQFDLIIGLEPVNRYETFLVNTGDQAIELMKKIEEPNVRVHLDSYHMNIEECDYESATRRARPHLCHFHLSESHRGTVGTGMVQWREILKTLVDTDYNGLVGMESFGEIAQSMSAATCIWRRLIEDTDTSLKEGLQYLRALEKEVRAEKNDKLKKKTSSSLEGKQIRNV